MTWAYLSVLNNLIQIIATILIGFYCAAFGIIPAALFVPQAVQAVFKILLPSLILNGVGIGIDFYADKNLWSFIVACELNRMRRKVVVHFFDSRSLLILIALYSSYTSSDGSYHRVLHSFMLELESEETYQRSRLCCCTMAIIHMD